MGTDARRQHRRPLVVTAAFVALAACVVAIVSLILSGTGGSDDDAPREGRTPVKRQVVAAVTPGRETLTTVGAVRIRLPAGAVDEKATLIAATSPSTRAPAGARIVGTPISVTLSTRLRESAVIDLPAERERRDAGAVPAYYDPALRQWVAAETYRRVSTGFRVVTDHFTLFAVLDFAGARADAPTCDPEPQAAVTYLADDPPGGSAARMLLACGEREGRGSLLLLKLVNNRPYTMSVRLPDGVQPGMTEGLEAVADALLGGNRAFIAPGGEVLVNVPSGGPEFSATPEPSVVIAAVGLAVDAVTRLGGDVKAQVAAADCVYFDAPDFRPSGAARAVRDCVKARGATARRVLDQVLVASATAGVERAAADARTAPLQRVRVNPVGITIPPPRRWTLSPAGIGPLRFGMTAEQARQLGVDVAVSRGGKACERWGIRGLKGVVPIARRGGPLRLVQLIRGTTGHGAGGVDPGDGLASLKDAFGAKLVAIETPPGFDRSLYRVNAATGRTAVQFTVKDGKVELEEAGFPSDLYSPTGAAPPCG